MNIVVLAGGLSPERNVSLSSGTLISAALRRKGHRVLLLDVYVGLPSLPDDPNTLFDEENNPTVTVGRDIPDLDALRAAHGNRDVQIGPNVIDLCRMADVTFLALHGAMGENGQLQAILDIYAIPYTGSGYLGSSLAMDKDVAKVLLAAAGVRVPHGVRLDCHAEPDLDLILETVGLPAVVKPCSCGSSVGVSLVDTRKELAEAIALAKQYEDDILVETRILGRELTCGILEGRVLPPVEIIPKSGFYDYANKYQAGATTEICPAPLSEEELAKVQKATADGFAALRLSSYARLDFILDAKGEVWCLEANTLPGMTPTSLLPQEAAAVGMDYDTLCDTLARSALNKSKH